MSLQKVSVVTQPCLNLLGLDTLTINGSGHKQDKNIDNTQNKQDTKQLNLMITPHLHPPPPVFFILSKYIKQLIIAIAKMTPYPTPSTNKYRETKENPRVITTVVGCPTYTSTLVSLNVEPLNVQVRHLFW